MTATGYGRVPQVFADGQFRPRKSTCGGFATATKYVYFGRGMPSEVSLDPAPPIPPPRPPSQANEVPRHVGWKQHTHSLGKKGEDLCIPVDPSTGRGRKMTGAGEGSTDNLVLQWGWGGVGWGVCVCVPQPQWRPSTRAPVLLPPPAAAAAAAPALKRPWRFRHHLPALPPRPCRPPRPALPRARLRAPPRPRRRPSRSPCPSSRGSRCRGRRWRRRGGGRRGSSGSRGRSPPPPAPLPPRGGGARRLCGTTAPRACGISACATYVPDPRGDPVRGAGREGGGGKEGGREGVCVVCGARVCACVLRGGGEGVRRQLSTTPPCEMDVRMSPYQV